MAIVTLEPRALRWCTGVVRTLAAVVVAAVAVAPAAAPPALAKGGATPLLGIVRKASKPQLVPLDPATLLPLGGGLPAAGAVPVWSFSPDGRQLALASQAPLRIRIVDVGEMRQRAALKLTGAGGAMKLAWLRPDRLVVVHTRPDGARIVWIDPDARRVLKRAVLDVAPGAVASGGDVVTALLPAGEGAGAARLVIATADGSLREVQLGAIPISLWAGPGSELFRRVSPGLTLDPAARRAYAVGTNGVVAEVDLDSLSVTNHVVARPFAKSLNGEELQARLIGDGTIAVAGDKYESAVDELGNETASRTPFGLRLIDVRTWTERTIDPAATGFALTAQGLLAYGSGVAAYAAGGAARFEVLTGRPVGVVQTRADRGYAWLADPKAPFRVAVIDLANGSVEREVALAPTSLLADY
jgi:hypothetical protein